MLTGLFIGLIVSIVIAIWLFYQWEKMSRAEYIRTYMFPPGLLQKFAEHRPQLVLKDQQMVARGLRQFFLAHLKSGRRYVSMPSQVVDDLWHEFILYTRHYEQFCSKAFGRFLHHTPAVVLGKAGQDNAGLRRCWWYSCLEENINPRNPTRLPLLFALDTKLNIPNGFAYAPDCQKLRRDGRGNIYCGSDFSGDGFDWGSDTSGDFFADASASDGGGGDSGGCGGGCGGGD